MQSQHIYLFIFILVIYQFTV